MNRAQYLLLLVLTTFSCRSQSDNSPAALVGGNCEGCEAVFEFADKVLTAVDTLPDFDLSKSKLRVTGTIYKKDGQTPAKNVIVYIYHTNQEGLYKQGLDATGWGLRHGALRGWVKTDLNGQYTFFTYRPASYPNSEEPAHIHITVKEPNKNEYYIDEFVFDDDPLLTEEKRILLLNRGGSGISKIRLKENILTIERDIVLGLNIPNYE